MNKQMNIRSELEDAMSKGSKKVVIVVCVLLIISLVCSYYLYTKLRGSTLSGENPK